jgi:hypothetical protein
MREQILERLRWAYKHSPRVVRKTLRPFRDIGADSDLALRAAVSPLQRDRARLTMVGDGAKNPKSMETTHTKAKLESEIKQED